MNVFKMRISPAHLSYISSKVRLRRRGKEFGLFAIEDIKKDEIVTITAGVVLPERVVKTAPSYIRSFAYYIENGFFLAPSTKNPSADWYMNHSCDPNTGSPVRAFTNYALRDIQAGEELLYDYAVDYSWNSEYKPFRKFKCGCGSKNCAKIIRW